MPPGPYDLSRSYELLARAERVVPGGVYGTRSVRFATYGKYPQFIREGRGCRLVDVDGNEYVDLMASFGPILLGHRHPGVEGAVREQAERGNAFTFPSERWVELAEVLVERIDVADWAVFAKSGSDVTTWATRLARAHTGRATLLVAEGAYHTFHQWGVPDTAGIPDAYRAHVDRFTFNDVGSLEAAFARHPGDVAGVMIAPFRHDAFHDEELPTPEYVGALRALCDRSGALLLLDDVRGAFRLHPSGCSHLAYGIRPDAVCYGKAIGNGHPISVAVGREALRETARSLYFSATHFFSAEPMAAALATLRAFDEEKAFDAMWRAGCALRDGMAARAEAAGLRVRQSGPPTMPFLRFEGDVRFRIAKRFAGEMALRGAIVHPVHNWFLTSAVGEEDLALVLRAAEEAFAVVRRAQAAGEL